MVDLSKPNARRASTVRSAPRLGRRLLAAGSAVLLLAVAADATAASAAPACAPDARARAVAAAWARREPIGALEFADVKAARCFQAAFIERLRPQLGDLVGYKVGLFSKAGQDRYGANGPVLGRLYRKMLLPDGATVRADYGAAPAWESDLLAVVGDSSINTATSREELYRALRSVRPFIELGNGNYAPSVKVNALQLEALDVGARLGVVGQEMRLDPGEQGLTDFLNLAIEASVKNGETVTVDRARAPTSLGDLIEVVRFARDAVVAQGGALRPGDVISLGVFTPSKAPRPGDTVTVTYGLGDRGGAATVKFK